MDSLDSLVPFSPRCLLWGVFASVLDMQQGIYLMQGSSIGLHTKQDLKRGARSRKRANEEERVVSITHPLLFCIIAMQLWKLAHIIRIALG